MIQSFSRRVLRFSASSEIDGSKERNFPGYTYITAADFKINRGKYLSLVSKGDIFITRNGRKVAKLSTTLQDKIEFA